MTDAEAITVLSSLRREQADEKIQTTETRMSQSQGETGEKQPLSAISVNCQSVGRWTSQDHSPSSSQAYSAMV